MELKSGQSYKSSSSITASVSHVGPNCRDSYLPNSFITSYELPCYAVIASLIAYLESIWVDVRTYQSSTCMKVQHCANSRQRDFSTLDCLWWYTRHRGCHKTRFWTFKPAQGAPYHLQQLTEVSNRLYPCCRVWGGSTLYRPTVWWICLTFLYLCITKHYSSNTILRKII